MVRRDGRGRAAAAARRTRRPGAADGGRRAGRPRPPRRDLERPALAGHRERRGHLADARGCATARSSYTHAWSAPRRPSWRRPPTTEHDRCGRRERHRRGAGGRALHGGVRRPARSHHPGRVRRPHRRPGRRPRRARQRAGAGAGADQARAGEGAQGEGREGAEAGEAAQGREAGEGCEGREAAEAGEAAQAGQGGARAGRARPLGHDARPGRPPGAGRRPEPDPELEPELDPEPAPEPSSRRACA